MNIKRLAANLPSRSRQELDGMRANAQRLIATGNDVQKAAASELVAEIDAHIAAKSQALSQRLSAVPVAQRVVEAFTAKPLTENERKVVSALLDNPGSTTTELSRAYGHDSMIWQMHFGNLCKAREAYLWPAPKAEKRDSSFYCGILVDTDGAGNRFTIKPDVAAAFAELGLTPKRPVAR